MLKLLNFINGTKPEEEYVEFLAIQDTSLNEYALLDNTFKKDGSLSNQHIHFIPLPSHHLKKGEHIRIYTGKGKNEQKHYSQSKTKVFFYYWGMNSCIWNNSEKDKVKLISYRAVSV